MFRKIFVVIVLTAITQPALGYFYDGNDLRESLREYRKAERGDKDTNFSKAWNFRGFVIGVYDATEDGYCTPIDFTSHQLMAVVAKYIEDNPQLWSEPAEHLVKSSIQSAFQCR